MEGKKLYVGNLSHCVRVSEETEQLKELFSQYGEIEGVNIVKGKRYGFVAMSNRSEADLAKSELNEYEFNGCPLIVNEVRSSKDKREYGRRRKR
jgi:RNA recognition motif-containing protein